MSSLNTVLTSGFEFKRYCDDGTVWPKGAYYDDEIIMVNGERIECVEAIQDADQISIEYGYVVGYAKDGAPLDLKEHFLRWRDAQSHHFVLVKVEKARTAEFTQMLNFFNFEALPWGEGAESKGESA